MHIAFQNNIGFSRNQLMSFWTHYGKIGYFQNFSNNVGLTWNNKRANGFILSANIYFLFLKCLRPDSKSRPFAFGRADEQS
jgi:hypothetical protein